MDEYQEFHMISLTGTDPWANGQKVYIRLRCEVCDCPLNVLNDSFLSSRCLHYYSYADVWKRRVNPGPTRCIKCNLMNEYTTEIDYVCYNCRV